MAFKVKIGIIGGSGLDDPDILDNRAEKAINTPFGLPSDVLITGKIGNVDCVLLARHGRDHTIMPSKVNYRANIWALKEIGCTHILVSAACGSLQEEIAPGHIVFIDQFIDRTHGRKSTFYDGEAGHPKGVCHIPMRTPFCEHMRQILIESATELNIPHHKTGTIVVIEGPRYSTLAESRVYQSWGGHTIGMTTCPEATLANELGIPYAAIAMATDYDCWRSADESVTSHSVLEVFNQNIDKVKGIIKQSVPKLAASDFVNVIERYQKQAANAVLTPADACHK